MKYKENFQITDKETGKTYWISRAMAVCGIILAVNPENQELFFLVEKRGEGCPDYVGYWANCCGYLGWGETRREALVREIKEELGLDFSSAIEDIYEWMTMDDPNDNSKQNVTTRFVIPADYSFLKSYVSSNPSLESEKRGGEAKEVAEIRLISEKDIDNYLWAWNHDKLLKMLVESYHENNTISEEKEEGTE